jgi:hypothetical protein
LRHQILTQWRTWRKSIQRESLDLRVCNQKDFQPTGQDHFFPFLDLSGKCVGEASFPIQFQDWFTGSFQSSEEAGVILSIAALNFHFREAPARLVLRKRHIFL